MARKRAAPGADRPRTAFRGLETEGGEDMEEGAGDGDLLTPLGVPGSLVCVWF